MDEDIEVLAYFESKRPWGMSTCIDITNCNPDLIRSEEAIKNFVDQLCDFIKMRKFGPCTVVNFGDEPRVSGFSMTQLIETSLISGHFANESNAAYLDIFSCSPYPPYAAALFAKNYFEAETMMVAINWRL